MRNLNGLPVFIAATLPTAPQWADRAIWRDDLNCVQISDGTRWQSLVMAAADTGNLTAGGAAVALSEATTESLATASATTQILTGPGEYFAYRCTVAAGNITIYDNTASSGKILVPTTALAVGTFPIYGAGIGRSVIVDTGIRVVLSGAATVYIGHMGY